MWKNLLANPYTLGVLVGLYPILFYLSNNWFMFKPYQSLVLVGVFALITGVGLSIYYMGLSWIARMLVPRNSERIIDRLFAFLAILVLAYLLRQTFLDMLDYHLFVFLVLAVMIAGLLAWFIPSITIYRVNSILMTLCVVSIGHAFFSIVTTETNTLVGGREDLSQQNIYDHVSFSQKPNVYLIVPDAYPNQEALETIYDIDNTEFYKKLEAFGFTLYHSAFSNYMNTLSSMSALFSMKHHLYLGSVGNFELLNSRELITGKHNPVVKIFKKNGYQVHYVHQREYVFMRGCFVDLCEPSVFWGEFLDILIPEKVKSLFQFGLDRSLAKFEENILRHIETISSRESPHFLYVHIASPNHSFQDQQTIEKLENFREHFDEKLDATNETLSQIVQRILTQDPNALIILNADHGAWGLGAYVWGDNKVLEGIPDNLVALDQLGVHLAIRWPDGVARYEQDIQTNVNLFRYIFVYLSEIDDILATKAPDNGYIMKSQEKQWRVAEVVRNGNVREQMVDRGIVQ